MKQENHIKYRLAADLREAVNQKFLRINILLRSFSFETGEGWLYVFLQTQFPVSAILFTSCTK